MKKNDRLVFLMNKKLFMLNPMLYLSYFLIQVVWSGTPILTALLINLLFDHLPEKEQGAYYILLLIFFAVNLAAVFLVRRAGIIDVLITFSVGKHIKNNLIRSLIQIKKNHINRSGEVLDILNYDISSMQYMLLTQMDLMCQLLAVLIGIVILAGKNMYLTLAIVLPTMVMVIVVWSLSEKYKEKYSEERGSSIAFSRFVSESIDNREAVQFLGDTQAVMERFDALRTARGKNRVKKQLMQFFITTNIRLINDLGVFFILLGFTVLLRTHSISIGEMTFFITFIGYSTGFLQLIKQTSYGIKEGGDSLGRIADLLGLSKREALAQLMRKADAADTEAGEIKAAAALEFKDFRLAENDCCHSFSFEKGDVIAVTGENGSGKSRFIDAILGYAPYEGEIAGLEDGVQIGYAAQEIKLFDDSVDRNISMYEETDPQKLTACKDMANVEASICRLKRCGVNGKEISEGQRQRVGIARALCSHSGILILDDAFSYLDKDNRKAIIHKIMDQNTILILVTNDANMIALASQVVRVCDLKITVERVGER